MEQTYMTKAIIEIYPDLQRFAFKLTANRVSADNLVQNSILKALNNADRYVRQENFKGWMYTIMYNIFVNNYRRSQREILLFDSDFTDYINQVQIVQEELIGNAYDRELMYKMVNNLPEKIKKPFELSVIGLKYTEIDERLPMGTIKSRLHFARKKLQDDLRESFLN